MKNAIFISIALFCVGCLSKSDPRNGMTGLSGQPSWFPLGGEVYHGNERFDAQKEILQFKSESRWFLGFPKAVTKEAFETWKKRRNGVIDMQVSEEHAYQIPSIPQYPKNIKEFPQESQGARLELRIGKAKTNGELILTLTLSAGDRVVRREIEHRWTNVTPFLFAFFADGEAVSRKLDAFGKMGGTNHLVEVVQPQKRRDWNLRVNTTSIDALVGAEAQEIAIVAAFSERQHEGYFYFSEYEIMDLEEVWNLKDLAPQITVRSNVIRLRRNDRHWEVLENR